MKKRSELFFNAIQVPMDAMMIFLAAMSAFAIRNIPEMIQLKPKLYNFPFKDYLKVIILVMPIFLLIYALEGLYNSKVTRKFWREAGKVFSATSIGLVIIIVAIFLQREWFSSRFVILAGWLIATSYVIFGRLILHLIQKWLLVHRGIGVHRILLIGTNERLKRLQKIISKNLSLGYKIVAIMENASLHNVKNIKKTLGVDEIVLCDSSLTDSEQEKLIDYCAINNVSYKFIPTTLQTANFEAGIFGGEPIIEIKHTPLEGWGRILKRTFDIFGSIFGIIIFSPIMLVIAILIKLESYREERKGGPVIYKNERIGSDGKKFFVYKFRYMKWQYCTDANTAEGRAAIEYEKKLISKMSIKKGPLYKIKNDPRKTRIGGVIERLSFDELPQFFNVFKGEMSLVGPRPHQEREVEKYSEYHRRLLTIRPGITGMAQVSGRSDLKFEDEYRLDVFYIENWSLWLDIQICLKTIGVLFKKRRN